jgi:VCBS repeat-containing protein
LTFSERVQRGASVRAVVTAFAVVIAGFGGPLALPVSAEETAAAPVSYLVTFAAGTSSDEQAAALADSGATDVDAIPQLRMHAVTLPGDTASSVADSLRALASVTNVNLDRTRVAEAAPDDPAYADQWALPKIGWDSARDAVMPAGSAVVAVLDTGVDGSHSDLSGQLVAGTSVLEGGDPLVDPNGHGTAMAGIVAADTNNGRGIAGVGYAGVKVMPVTVLGADGTGQDSDIISGVVWAADHGADVILMSFSNPGYSAALQAALDYAWSNGAVLVAATGNDGSSTATFPAGSSGVVGVSSTNASDELASSSNYGADTFLAAPGVGIVTTQAGGGTTSVTGTSAAAAIVAGSAGLLAAADGSAGPGAIVGRLARNADAAGSAEQTGNGRVNLGRSVSDTSSDAVKPDGAAPVGDGGPAVGPYVAADKALTVVKNGTGSGTVTSSISTKTGDRINCGPTCVASFDNNETVTITASPGAGSTFAGWAVTGGPPASNTCVGTTSPCTLNMNNNAFTLTATFNTAAVNQAPVANNDSYSVAEDGTLTVSAPGVLSNDTDANPGTTLSVATPRPVTAPTHGALTLNADGSFSYVPDPNYAGPDSFTYRASDGTLDSVTAATVSITVTAVNDAPTATAQSATTNEDTAQVITLTSSDADGNSMAFSIVSGPTHGTLGSIGAVTCTGATPNSCSANVTYTPASNYFGSDGFAFKVNDGSVDSTSATVSITVNAVDDAPTAVPDSATVAEDSGANAIDVLANDTDID